MRINLIVLIAMGLPMAVLFTAGCNGSDPNGPDPDTTPPTVVSTSPEDGDTLQIRDSRTEILAQFSEEIDPGSVTESSFLLENTIIVGPPWSVPGTVSVDSATASFIPDDRLAHGTVYAVRLAPDITDLSGNHLAEEYIWSFATTPDPNLLPPTVVSTDPLDGSTNVELSPAFDITMTFDKPIDGNTFAMTLEPSGGDPVVSVDGNTVTYSPSTELQYSTTYTAIIGTATADTFGIHLAEPYEWSFTTETDPLIPTVGIIRPQTTEIIGDTVTITALAGHPVGVARVEFYIDGAHIPAADDFTEPWEYLWDASSLEIGSSHSLSVRAYDADERVGYSDTVYITYLWEKLALTNDADEDWLTDIKMIYARSTDSLLELRVECWEDWFDPYDTILDDTTLDLAFYFDADADVGTGRTYLGIPSHPLNGIGADYQSIVGIHGNKAFSQFSAAADSFVTVHDPTEIPYLNWPADTNVFEIGLAWSDFGGASALRMVAINAFYTGPEFPIFDWFPDEGTTYITLYHDGRYIGETGAASAVGPIDINHRLRLSNPFNGRIDNLDNRR